MITGRWSPLLCGAAMRGSQVDWMCDLTVCEGHRMMAEKREEPTKPSLSEANKRQLMEKREALGCSPEAAAWKILLGSEEGNAGGPTGGKASKGTI